MSKFKLADLEKRVQQRAKASAKESYTRALLDKGVGHCVKKLNEEAFETGLAAVQESKRRVIAEASDLLYHLLASSLLLHEGQALRDRSQDFRKLLVGALYVQRWLAPRDAHAPPFSARDLGWLDSMISWTSIPAAPMLNGVSLSGSETIRSSGKSSGLA